MPQQDPSRTEQATPRRKNKARDEGNVPRSQELSKALVLLGGFAFLLVFLKNIGTELLTIIGWFFGPAFSMQLNEETIYQLLIMIAHKLAKMLLPVLILLAIIAFVAVRVQVGQLWTTKVFNPKLDKILNPFAGMQKLFISTQTVVRLSRSLLQAAAVAIAPYLVLKSKIDHLIPLFYNNVHGIVYFILTSGALMVTYALVPILVIAFADLIYTRWDYEENLKMTKSEVKDERKQSEGDPSVKGEQRKKMFAVMGQRMMEQVPEADVVITNPTHLAVAIKYNPLEAPAPVVLAKGANHVAERIKDLAREHDIPIRENKPLAQALYTSVEVGDIIPEELYKAVASILAQLYKYKQKYGN